MRRVLPAALILTLCASLGAQSLLSSVPKNVVAYARAKGGWEAFEKIAGNKALWKSPVDLDEAFFGQMDKGLDQMGKMLGIEAGSMGSYFRSIQGWELVIYTLDLDDGFSEMDFVVAIDTPMAKQIYELTSGVLLKRAFAEKTEDGDLEVPLEEDFGLNIARRDDKLLIAGSAARLRETMSNYGQVLPGNLAQSNAFKRAVGRSDPNFVGYLDVGTITRLAGLFGMRAPRGNRRNSPRANRNQMARTSAVELKLNEIKTFCWAETETGTRIDLGADKTVVPFELLAGRGSPTLMGQLPASTVFAFNWTGQPEVLWKGVKEKVITNPAIPFSPMAAEGIRTFQKKTGLKVDELAALFDGGLAMGMVPGARGRVEPVMVARCTDPTKASDVAGTLMEAFKGKSKDDSADLPLTETRGDSIWYFPEGRKGDHRAAIVISGNSIVMGPQHVVTRSLDATQGKAPNLLSSGALRGLRQGSSVYLYLGYKALLGTNDEFSAAYHMVSDQAAITASVKISKTNLLLETSAPVGEVMSILAIAGSQQEAMRKHRRTSLNNLKKIEKAYGEYVGRMNKHPKTLSDLGFSGKDRLVCPLDAGKNRPTSAYVLVPGPISDEGGSGYYEIRAYSKNTAYGRLVLSRSGSASVWPEARFIEAMKKIKK